LERDRTQNLIALPPESGCRAVVFPTTIKPDAMCVRRMARLLN
jgi:hypothetical protein